MIAEGTQLFVEHHAALKEHLSGEDIVKCLLEDGIIDTEIQNNINALPSQGERAEALLKVLVESNNPKAMDAFKNALENCHTRVIQLLNKDTIQSPKIEETTEIVSKKVLGEAHLWYISKLADILNWARLGRALKLDETTLKQIDHLYSEKGFREMAYQMLLQWKQQNPEYCNVKSLDQAFEKAHMYYAMQQLRKLSSELHF